MNESQLRDRLAAVAAATTTDRVAAWDRISAGRRRPSVARRLVPVGALALGVAAVVLAVNIAGNGSRVTATGPAAANLPNRPAAIEGSVYGLAPDRTGCGSRVCPAVHPITLDVTSRSMAPLGPDTQPGEPAGIENIQWQNGQLWVLGTRNGSPTGIGTLASGQLSMVIPSSDLANSEGAQEAHGAHNGSLAVSPEGRIAWTGYRNEADGNQFREVYERAASGGPIRVVYRSDQVHLGGLVYGPDGTLAVFELDMQQRAERQALMLIGPNGVKRRITVPRDEQGLDDFFIAPTISWSNRGLLAVSAGWIGWGTDPTYIIDAGTGKLVRTIKNAHAQAWSPDGTGILVVRSKTGRDGRLSVAYGPGLAKEKDLGPLPDALTLRTWVAPEMPNVEAEQSWPLWPEHSSLGVRAAEAEGQQAWRTDPTETALRFAREVLGWTDAQATGSREIRHDPSPPTIAVSITNATTDGVVYVKKWSASYYSVSGGASSKTMEESFGVQVVGRHLKVGIIDFGTPKVEVTVWYGDHFQSETFGPKRDVAEFNLAFPALDVPANLLIL